MNAENLSKILKNHKLWLEDEEGGIKANLSGANLSLADLSGANLSWRTSPYTICWSSGH